MVILLATAKIKKYRPTRRLARLSLMGAGKNETIVVQNRMAVNAWKCDSIAGTSVTEKGR